MQDQCIEVLLASYNGALYIHEQIDSILDQTDTCWHLTVSDDCSGDGTALILDGYAREFPTKIRCIHSGKRFGNAKQHFLWLTETCEASYIAYSDQDDVWLPDKLERLRRHIAEAEQEIGSDTPILVFSDQTVTDEHLKPIALSLMRYQKQYFEHFDYRSILMQNVVTGGAMMINRALADLAMRCADTSQIIMHDWWFAAVAARFGRIVYIDEPLGAYRQHGDNSVGAKDVRSMAYVKEMVSSPIHVRNKLLHKKSQAHIFAETFAGQLNDEDRTFLLGFIKKQSGPLFYWKNRHLIHGSHRLAGMMLLG